MKVSLDKDIMTVKKTNRARHSALRLLELADDKPINSKDRDIKKTAVVSLVPNLHQISECGPSNKRMPNTKDSGKEKPIIRENI